ncbi:GlsB/YeaQ/YmgE family stress response membrane protein [Anabaena sp. WFMT]|uniref:GlsB/YeaQ/YmgE family stress response membrane protein n=1 Tax=Anabaena sp. WFMT TaxID=3449730 RepID=UPI003F228D8E
MTIIAWIVLGLISGAIAKAIDPAARGSGILGTLVLGIIGAFVGGTLTTLITTGKFALVGSTLTPSGIFIAVIGAVIAVFVWHRINGRSSS